MSQTIEVNHSRKDNVLIAAMLVFGKFGYRKTSIDDIAAAAKISKQGLYLYFSSKEEIFLEAHLKYLDDGLILVQEALDKDDASLYKKIVGAMDAWFGRHYETFSPQSFDVIETGDNLSGEKVEKFKDTFRAKIAKAISDSAEYKSSKNICSPKEIAQTLFTCGLTWKERHHKSRIDFIKKIAVCVKVCCQVEI
jgi:AcrR family transcriptional regulator